MSPRFSLFKSSDDEIAGENSRAVIARQEWMTDNDEADDMRRVM